MNKKILIIEDDANLLYGLQAKFSLAGFNVEINSGNVEITEIMSDIKKFKPDYIILDLLLPKVDGFDILNKLKADKETADLPVFIFTNLSDKDSKEKGVNLNVAHYFIKGDFSIDDFVEKIMKIIKNKEKMK